jgi:hypothetical protein
MSRVHYNRYNVNATTFDRSSLNRKEDYEFRERYHDRH